MKRKILNLVSVIVLIALIGATATACKSDEASVEGLVYRSTEAENNQDYRAMYEMMSPNYRDTLSYSAFEEAVKAGRLAAIEVFGTAHFEISDIEVRVTEKLRGRWAYAIYTMTIGDFVFRLLPGDEDIFRKVGDKWYDVADNRDDPGYNLNDLPGP